MASQVNLSILNTKSKDLQLIQANVQKSLLGLQLSPFQGGNYLTNLSLTSGTPLVINHQLGRQPVIWSLGDQNANANVWRSGWTTSTITLNSSANCTVSIWVN